MQQSTVSILVEINEDLFDRLRQAIAADQSLDQDKLISAALLLYLPLVEAKDGAIKV